MLLVNFRIIAEKYPQMQLYERMMNGEKRYYYKIEGDPKRYYIGWKQPELQPGERRKSYPTSENTAYRSELKHDTGLGFYTNSKSEAIIALRYHAFGVPFQYEKKLRLAHYHAADILLGRDLFVTMDGPNEDLDVAAIDRFIIHTILPLCTGADDSGIENDF